ncbi:MAG: nucleotidyltransferase domain-containing protein [Desulfobacterales bacterium]|nr:nucleotidyltransferase domain-containing protein [Desulfobacterales bacterium]
MEAAEVYFLKREDVAFAYLFGSRAAGRTSPMSDYDFAVYLTKTPFSEKRFDILGDLMGLLKTDDIDLVVLNTAPISLRMRILQKRIILADNNPYTRHNFESLTMRESFDFSKFEAKILQERYYNG